MTLSIETSRMDYTGDGGTTTYPYSFKIFDETHLLVTQRDTSDVETTLVLNTDYTVTGAGESTGGDVELASALTLNFILTIRRVVPLTQETDIRNQGQYKAALHEDEFDLLVMADQQLQDQLNRTVGLSETEDPADFDGRFPGALAGFADIVPITNGSGDGWAEIEDWPSGADIADAAANAALAAASAAQAAAFAGSGTPYGILNLGLSASVGANAIAIALKQADGSTDPSTGAATVTISFRSSTLTSGAIISRTITSALSMEVTAGATLGHNDSLPDYIYVYAIDNAGTVELAVSSSSHWDEGTRVTTTTMSNGADDAATMYSTTGRTNVAFRLIGRILSTQTTAGTWSSALTEVTSGITQSKIFNQFSKAAAFNLKHGTMNHVSSAATRNIQLPVPRAGFWAIIKDSTGGGNAFTLVRNGAESIDGVAANYTLLSLFGAWRISSDGTNYFVEHSQQSQVSETYMARTATYTIQTSFTTLDLTTITDSVGTPITVSTNTITFPFTGRYMLTLNCSAFSSGSRDIICRLRNISDNTTLAISTSFHIASDDGQPTFMLWFNITDTSKNYEVQLASDLVNVTLDSVTVDSTVGSSWKLFIRRLVQ